MPVNFLCICALLIGFFLKLVKGDALVVHILVFTMLLQLDCGELLVLSWRVMQVELLAHQCRIMMHRNCLMVLGQAKFGRVRYIIDILSELTRSIIAMGVKIVLLVMRNTMQHAFAMSKGIWVLPVVHDILHRLHLDHKVAICGANLLRVKDATISLKAATRLVPPATIKGVEVITPVELKFVQVLIVGEDFDVVVQHIPWHVSCVEALAPRLECWRPEIHSDRLSFVDKFYRFNSIGKHVAHLSTINREANVLRRPLELVRVPIVMRFEVGCVVMVLELVLAITVDDVQGEGVVLDGGHDLTVELIPASSEEVGAIPVRKERADCSFFVRCLHPGHELAVGEFLI